MKVTSKSAIDSTPSTKRLTFNLTLAACLIFWIFVFVDSGWGPNLTPLSIQLHTPLSIVGLFYVIWSTGYLPGALVGGAMLDRYGPGRVLFVAALIVLSGMLLILLGVSAISWKPFAPYVPVAALLVVAGLAGSGGGVIDATTNGLISSVYAQKRGSALNLFNLLYPLGGVCIALIDAGLLTLFHNDPRPPLIFTLCFIMIAMLSLTGIPHRYMLETQTALTPEEGEEPRPSRSLLAILTPVIIVMMLTSGISSSTRAWTPAYLHVVYGQTPAIAAALSSVSWMLAASSRLGASILITRIGAWRMVMLGVTVSLIGLIGMTFSPNAPLATLAIALTSIGLSPIFATCLAIGSERAGRSPGAVAGILLFAAGISTVFCSWFFGFLLNGAGPLWAVGFCFVCMVMGGLLALRLRG
jgi:fucose permease